MLLGVIALLVAVYAGVLRLDWDLPPLRIGLSRDHAPLMISGFLGTLISLERAVALGRRWSYGGPALTALGAVALIFGSPGSVGPYLMTAGSVILLIASAHLLLRRPALFSAIITIGAGLWVVSNGLWVGGWALARLMPWWAGFLVVTIAGERLELSRLLRPPGFARAAFLISILTLLAGLVVSGVAFDLGMRTAGMGMLLLGGWLLLYDIARWTLREAGLPRYIAVGLLSGYAWLSFAGALWLLFGGNLAGPHYDAMIHAIFLGFVFSMIFAHAPIIFPAVLGVTMSFSRAFYLHLAVLHSTLLLRVSGDLLAWLPGHRWGGVLNAAAILIFLANTLRGLRRTTLDGPGEATLGTFPAR